LVLFVAPLSHWRVPRLVGLPGAAGGLCGGFVGFQVRTGLVKAFGVPDFLVALSEDALAIASAILVVTHV